MTSKASRREFLKRASALSMAGSAAPLAINMAAVGEASAAVASDYKALVCVFLYGGNDYANTVVPFDVESHGKYKQLRPVMGFERAQLQNTVLSPAAGQALPNGRQYALAPTLEPLKNLFQEGRAAVLLNIGTLIEPTSKANFLQGNVLLPPNLFSHNDQQSFWQSCSPEGAQSGWGGRMGDVLAQKNSKALFTCINPAGNAVFMSGESIVPYRISPAGSIPINPVLRPLMGSAACSQLLKELASDPHRVNLYRRDHTAIVRSSIGAQADIAGALAGVPATMPRFAQPDGSLANALEAQFNMVARCIASSSGVGAKRQVFFVSLGGFDNHDGLGEQHPALMEILGNAISKFYKTTEDLGVAKQVTTFTASDFGRSWGNDDGSDHGWGSMHFVVGGAVNGGRFFGDAPEIITGSGQVVREGGPDDVGNGRLLPKIAVDNLAASLGQWMGLSNSQLLDILPNLKNWNPQQRFINGLMRA